MKFTMMLKYRVYTFIFMLYLLLRWVNKDFKYMERKYYLLLGIALLGIFWLIDKIEYKMRNRENENRNRKQ